MKVIGLLSGGKDSCFNLMHCVAAGHDLVALATLAPPAGQSGEMDSWMYQTAGHDAVHVVAEAIGLPLYRGHIVGTARDTGAQYAGGDDADETEDLTRLLRTVLVHHPDADAVSVGAIESNYQRVRVEHVCSRMGLSVLAYLWKRPQATLVREMVSAGLDAVLIKVAGAGLGARDLGKSLGMLCPKLDKLAQQYGAHVAGEGGEYETLTLDSPLHIKGKVHLGQAMVVMHTDTGGIADVAYLAARNAVLEPKDITVAAKSRDTIVSGAIPRPSLMDKLSYAIAQGLPLSSSHPAPHYPPASLLPWSVPSTPAVVARNGDSFTITVACANAEGMTMAAQEALGQVKSTMIQHGLCMTSSSSRTKEGETKELVLVQMDHVNVYLSSQAHFAAFNTEYGKNFGVAPPSRACIALPPSSTTSEQAGLAMTLTGRVCASSPGQDARHARSALHVQSRSYWAPANIGPYAQAVVSASGNVSIAGQIALVPASMEIPQAAGEQAILALQHVRRILRATLVDLTAAPLRPPDGGSKHFIQGAVAWITDRREGPGVNNAVPVMWPVHEYASACALADAAHAVWRHSLDSSSDDEDEVEGEREEVDPEQAATDAWHATWTGQTQGLSRCKIPILYAVLPSGALPRQARIEWQVLAHTGNPSPELIAQVRDSVKAAGAAEDSDNEDDEEPRVQAGVSSAVEEGYARYDLLGTYGGHTVSQYRMEMLRLDVPGVLAHLSSDKNWNEVRVLLATRTDASKLQHPATSSAILLPVLDLFAPHPITQQLESWDVAIVSTR